MVFHLSESSLLEEYAIARHMWGLSTLDLSEIARNSVLQSGFSHEEKLQWLGGRYASVGGDGLGGRPPRMPNCTVSSNEPDKTNVSDIRVSFRQGLLEEERKYAAVPEECQRQLAKRRASTAFAKQQVQEQTPGLGGGAHAAVLQAQNDSLLREVAELKASLAAAAAK